MLVGHTSVVFSLAAFTENRVLVKRFTLWFPTGQKVLGLPRDKGESKIYETVSELSTRNVICKISNSNM